MDNRDVSAELNSGNGKPAPIGSQPVDVYINRLSPGSRRTMLQALDTIAATINPSCDRDNLPWHWLRRRDTEALRQKLAARYSAATANKMLSALRGVLQECWRLGLMQAEDYFRSVDVEPVKGTPAPPARTPSQEDIQKLFAHCRQERTALGARDGAILGMLYYSGLKKSELVRLALDDYDPETGAILVRPLSGNASKVVQPDRPMLELMARWLSWRGASAGPLFCPADRIGRVELRPITEQAVFNTLRKRADELGLKGFQPGTLRKQGAVRASQTELPRIAEVLFTRRALEPQEAENLAE